MEYKAKSWQLPETYIGKLSKVSIDEHIKLYQGYIKHFNLAQKMITEIKPEPGDEQMTYALSEVYRRMSFEWNGIKNHEYYFEQLVGGPKGFSTESALYIAITESFGSWDAWTAAFIQLAKTRGIGWAVVWRDRETSSLMQGWVDEQHLGQLNSCDMVFAIDMWEHSFVYDYQPSGKAAYIADYIANVNWEVVENRFV